MKTKLSVEIDRPIDEVFQYTINHAADWSKTVISDEVIEDKNGGDVGTTFRVITEERGKQMQFMGEVLRHERPTASRVMLKGDLFDIDIEYLFADLGNSRTKVTQQSRVIANSRMMKVMFISLGWLLKGSGRKALQSDFDTLKRQLESQT